MSRKWINPAEVVAAQQAYARQRNVARMHRVAASLQPIGHPPREASPGKQETPEVPATEVSTARPLLQQEVRAAGAQSDTVRPR
jgi:hypothetical protein